jgi:NAD(P)H dehydrogenase (quinone)
MTDVNVMVVFYSRYGETERLALAAGLGAVQAHANLRLRRLKDLADAETILRDPRWSESLERLIADYIAPRDIDADWADVILLVACPDSPAETDQYLTALRAHSDNRGKLQIVSAAEDPAERLGSVLAQGKQAVEATRKRRLGANA